MNLEEKAQEYALAALQDQLELVKKAYIDGYNAGKEDAIAPTLNPTSNEEVDYIDLNLPTKDQWSLQLIDKETGLPLQLPYTKVKDWAIPTVEDIKNLTSNTKRIKKENGEEYLLATNGVEYPMFGDIWLKDVQSDTEATIYLTSHNAPVAEFMGEAHPVVLIKRNRRGTSTVERPTSSGTSSSNRPSSNRNPSNSGRAPIDVRESSFNRPSKSTTPSYNRPSTSTPASSSYNRPSTSTVDSDDTL